MSNFNDSLKGLTGYQINITLNDGTKLSGLLAEVSTDYLTVYSSENETLYYPISHIQAVTKNSKYVEASPITDDHLKGEKMSDVLSQSLLSWVTINGSGKASYSGILSAVEEDHIVLTQGKDRVYLKHASVLNIYDGTKKTTSIIKTIHPREIIPHRNKTLPRNHRTITMQTKIHPSKALKTNLLQNPPLEIRIKNKSLLFITMNLKGQNPVHPRKAPLSKDVRI